jgi:tetratricopeptide (TPR) repeat protein
MLKQAAMNSRIEIRRLMQAGRKAEALSQLVAAVQCAAPDRDSRLTLARLANELGQHALAAEHARALIGVDLRDSEAWSALGTAEFGLRHPREALDALRRAVEISPAYGPARANLAAVLADQEHAEEALIHASEARRHGVKPRGVALIEARALIQLDRFDEAERLLLSLIAGDAQDVGAHDILLQLRQLRGDDDPLGPLRKAAQTHAAQPRVRLALANAARRLGAAPDAEEILRELLRTLGPDPTLLTSLATVLQETGSNGEALQAAQAAFAQLPDDPTAAENFVVAALAAGAHEQALPVVEKFRARSSRDQRWITYRLDLARLRGESEFAAWYDPARVVSVLDLPVPAGYSSIAEFHAALTPALISRHRSSGHPLDQSLRHGTQTSRNLLLDPGTLIAALLGSFRTALADLQSRIGHDAAHPLTGRNLSPAQIVGCWSVRLRRGGYHVNHIHPQGWVSSAYYVSIPPEVDDPASRSGWLKFGEPRFKIPGLAPLLHIQPKPGRLVLFPSYLWHGTEALRDDTQRLSVAFDALPQAELS